MAVGRGRRGREEKLSRVGGRERKDGGDGCRFGARKGYSKGIGRMKVKGIRRGEEQENQAGKGRRKGKTRERNDLA